MIAVKAVCAVAAAAASIRTSGRQEGPSPIGPRAPMQRACSEVHAWGQRSTHAHTRTLMHMF